MSLRTRKWLFWVPVIAGILIAVVLKKTQQPPEQAPPSEQAQAVRVIPVPRTDLVPRASGYGSVEPARVWSALAQVSGKILERHPELEKGNILDADTLILRIDPADYELNLAQIEADLAATQAQLQELEAKEANTRASIGIEQEALDLAQKELERKHGLLGKGSVSQSELEKERLTLLTKKQSVQNLRNTLNLMPAQRALLEAQALRQQRQIEAARRDLEHTEIRMPFRGRISAAEVEQYQYVRQGELLASADGIRTARVVAQLPIQRMATLIRSSESVNIATEDSRTIRDVLGVAARVHLQIGEQRVTWDGRLDRLSDTFDPDTRTVGVVVEVDEPYRLVQPGRRPPLVKGMFVEVELIGKPRPDTILIPSSALHGDVVYLVDAEKRLEVRRVTGSRALAGVARILSGLDPGERLVVSDPVPAIAGMLLEPIEDEEALERLLALAGGEPETGE